LQPKSTYLTYVTVLERSKVMSVLSCPIIQLQGRSRSRAPSAPADVWSVSDNWLSCCCWL